MKKIGIYGGSFNPPHRGHLRLAKELKEKLSLSEVIIIPSNISPQKSDNGKIEPYHRFEMCRKTFSDSGFIVSDCELARGGKSYTFDTLNYLKQEYPDGEFYLFMGSDMLLSFDSWYRYKDLLEMCRVCAISREKDESTDIMKRYVKENLDGTDKIIISDVKPFEISSTQIRDKLKNGDDCSEYLTDGTLKYIKDNKLYGQ